MTDSFAAVLMVGLWSVQEASPATRFEYFSLVSAAGSRCVFDVQKFIDRWRIEPRYAGSTVTLTLSGS